MNFIYEIVGIVTIYTYLGNLFQIAFGTWTSLAVILWIYALFFMISSMHSRLHYDQWNKMIDRYFEETKYKSHEDFQTANKAFTMLKKAVYNT